MLITRALNLTSGKGANIYKTFALTGALLVSACAQTADQIAPEVTSAIRYSNWACPALSQEFQQVAGALSVASQSQNRAAKTDFLSVFLIGIPVSGGGNPQEVSQLKGQQLELRATLEIRQCR